MFHSLINSSGTEYSPVLQQIHFGFLSPYLVAGMGEPWIEKMTETHTDLKNCGISAILTLTEDNLYGDRHVDAGFRFLHEPMNDGEAPSVTSLERAVTFISLALETGQGVAVHCLEGRGRTGIVLCAWLAAKEKLPAAAAISRLRNLRPYTALSADQKTFLLKYLD